MRLNKKTARSLAVRYHAYLEAVHAEDLSGVVCWGPLLIETQALTGVVLCNPEHIRVLVGGARRKIIAKEQAQAADRIDAVMGFAPA